MTVVGRPDAIGTGQRDHRLLVIAVVTLVGTLSAFALIAVRQPGRLDRYTPLVSFHATLMAAWYLLVAVQSWLIVGRDRRTHRRLGLASVALATGMVVTGAIVALDFHEETGRLVTLIADLGILVNFAPLYAAGVIAAFRGRFAAHKRLLLVASLCMVGPALARGLDVVGIPRPAAIVLFPAIIVGVPWYYDRGDGWRGLHRASRAAIAYTMLVFSAQVAAFALIGGR